MYSWLASHTNQQYIFVVFPGQMLISLPPRHSITQYGACIVNRSVEGMHVKAIFKSNLSEEDKKKIFK
jgi:hypothetical protein